MPRHHNSAWRGSFYPFFLLILPESDKIPNMADKLLLQVGATDSSLVEYRFEIEFYIFRQEDGVYIAYCPALDISTSAATYNDAISSFYEMFQLHIECCVESGTLNEDLLSHGWKVTKKSITPPSFRALMKKPEMKKLMESHVGFERIVAPARIPVHA